MDDIHKPNNKAPTLYLLDIIIVPTCKVVGGTARHSTTSLSLRRRLPLHLRESLPAICFNISDQILPSSHYARSRLTMDYSAMATRDPSKQVFHQTLSKHCITHWSFPHPTTTLHLLDTSAPAHQPAHVPHPDTVTTTIWPMTQRQDGRDSARMPSSSVVVVVVVVVFESTNCQRIAASLRL